MVLGTAQSDLEDLTVRFTRWPVQGWVVVEIVGHNRFWVMGSGFGVLGSGLILSAKGFFNQTSKILTQLF